jgi:hypothetical protein
MLEVGYQSLNRDQGAGFPDVDHPKKGQQGLPVFTLRSSQAIALSVSFKR